MSLETRTLSLPAALLVAAACGAREPQPEAPASVAPAPVVQAPAPTPAPAPTLRLPDGAAPLRYRASLEIDPRETSFRGHIEIDVAVARALDVLWLNARGLTIEKAVLRRAGTDATLTAEPARSFVALRGAVPAGEATLILDYTGVQDVGLSNGMGRYTDAGDWYVVTHFEPNDARRVFPCFDEPGFKVPWQVDLTVPAGMMGLTNTSVDREETLPDGRRRLRFRPTRPLPSYLIAIAVGPFEAVDAGASRTGIPTRIVVPRGRAGDARSAVAEVGKVLAYLEDYTGIPYDYDKLDHLAIPGTQRGAMEHPGLVTYGPRWLLIRDGESVTAIRGQVGIVAHELAHQWFGDLVTTAWWDDIWLNEAFATWMTPKVIEATHPEMDGALEPISDRATALNADSLASARQVRQPIAVEADMRGAFDRITYSKGATVIRMFERWVGPEIFQKAARAYLRTHADKNATATDFLAELDRATDGKAVGAAFASFLDQPGVPEVAMELRCQQGSPAVLTLSQSRYVPAGAAPVTGEPRWQIPICVAVPDGKDRSTHCTLLTEARAELRLGDTCPAWLLPNVEGAGYYLAALPTETLSALLDRGWSHLSRVERLTVLGDVEMLVDAGQADLTALLSLLPRLGASGDPYLLEVAMTRLSKLAPFIAPEHREAFARLLRATLGTAGKRIGWTPKRKEKLAEARLRGKLMSLLAVEGEDPAARSRATALARDWLSDHRKVPESLWTPVLQTAIQVSPKDIAPALFARLETEQDRVAQRAIYQALSVVRDAALQTQALALTLAKDPIPPEQSHLFAQPMDLERQIQLLDFERQHADELLPRMSDFMKGNLVNHVCDAAHRDEVAAFLKEKLAPIPEIGPRSVAQRIETMDQCIARRAAQASAVAAFLTRK